MKDFDSFDGLSEEEVVAIHSRVAERLGLENDGGNTRIPLESLPSFSAALSNAMTLATLRKYHEWLQSDDQAGQ